MQKGNLCEGSVVGDGSAKEASGGCRCDVDGEVR